MEDRMYNKNDIAISASLKSFIQNKQWGEIIIFLFIGLVPVLSWAQQGYLFSWMKNVSEGKMELPPWSEIAEHFIKGLKWLVASLVYSLPIIVSFIIGFVMLIVRIFDFAQENGLMVSRDFWGGFGNSFYIYLMFNLLLILPYLFLYSLFIPALQANFVEKNTIASFFDIKTALLKVKKSDGLYWRVWFRALLLSLVLSLILLVIYGIFIFALAVPSFGAPNLQAAADTFSSFGLMISSVLNVIILALMIPVHFARSYLYGIYIREVYTRGGSSDIS